MGVLQLEPFIMKDKFTVVGHNADERIGYAVGGIDKNGEPIVNRMQWAEENGQGGYFAESVSFAKEDAEELVRYLNEKGGGIKWRAMKG